MNVPRFTPRHWAQLALVCLGLYVVLIVLAHLGQPDWDMRNYYISHYARSNWGWLITLSFVIGGLIPFCLGLAYREHELLAFWGFVAAAIIFIPAGFFRADIYQAPATLEGRIHIALVLVSGIVLYLAFFQVAFTLDPFPYSRTLAVLVTLVFVVNIISSLDEAEGLGIRFRSLEAIGGLIQRFFVVVVMTNEALLALAVLRRKSGLQLATEES